MRQVMPNTGWRVVDNNVPDYIPVQFQMEAAEAVRQIMDDMEVPTRDIAELVSNAADDFFADLPAGPVFLDGNTFITSSNTTANTVYHVEHSIGGFDTMTTTSTNTTRMEMSMDDVHEARRRLEELHSEMHSEGETGNIMEEAIDDSDLEEPEPITKRKIVRRKKERPMFWKEETVGERTTLPVLIGEHCSNLQREGNSYESPSASSVFVKMIPLKLLNNSFEVNHRGWSMYSSNGRRNNYQRHIESASLDAAMAIAEQGTGVSQLVNSLIINGRVSTLARESFKMHTADSLNAFIRDVNLVNVAHNDNSAGSFDYTQRAFIGGESFRINARTFSVSLGQLTCFLETSRWSRVFTPQVMGIILPENYVYQKQHVLVHGTIDLSKVVVLVNRELDDTSFHNKNFRAYYRKHILPLLNSLKVDVWKVPVSFMEENCFHGGITLEKTSFMEKKQELENIYETFRDQYSHIDLDPHPDHNGDSDDDDFDEDYDDDDDDY